MQFTQCDLSITSNVPPTDGVGGERVYAGQDVGPPPSRVPVDGTPSHGRRGRARTRLHDGAQRRGAARRRKHEAAERTNRGEALPRQAGVRKWTNHSRRHKSIQIHDVFIVMIVIVLLRKNGQITFVCFIM